MAGRGDEAPIFRSIRENQIRAAALIDTAIGQGWATQAELEGLHDEIAEIARRNDLFGFVVFIRALGWVGPKD